jgi:hypothetical protein
VLVLVMVLVLVLVMVLVLVLVGVSLPWHGSSCSEASTQSGFGREMAVCHGHRWELGAW